MKNYTYSDKDGKVIFECCARNIGDADCQFRTKNDSDPTKLELIVTSSFVDEEYNLYYLNNISKNIR